MGNKIHNIYSNGDKLPLIDKFYTVQGEGFHTGKAAYFIRLGGCDIGCSWCDTKFSWNFQHHKYTDVESILNEVQKHGAKAVVVTGGEPSLYNLEKLTKILKKNNIETFIETAGTNKLNGIWDWICLSPKEQNPPLEYIYKIADELKVIISDIKDFEWAEKNSRKVSSKCKLFLQPEWSKHRQITKEIVEYVKQNQKWQVSIQAHKYMKIP